MYLIIGLIIAVVIGVLFFYKKTKVVSTTTDIVEDDKVKKAILKLINEVILDYRNEYLMNYLGARYNIKEFEPETSYVFKTKRIGSLANIMDFDQVPFGKKYLTELIVEKYNINIPVDDQLSFITEVSRIEGKIEAVESVKALLPEEDYNRLTEELQDDIIYYKKRYTNIK